MKIKVSRKGVERAIYIIVILSLLAYGLKDSELAVKLIHAFSQAFSILLTT